MRRSSRSKAPLNVLHEETKNNTLVFILPGMLSVTTCTMVIAVAGAVKALPC